MKSLVMTRFPAALSACETTPDPEKASNTERYGVSAAVPRMNGTSFLLEPMYLVSGNTGPALVSSSAINSAVTATSAGSVWPPSELDTDPALLPRHEVDVRRGCRAGGPGST